MSTNFPGSLDTYTTKVDNTDDVLAAHINDPQDAIEALEAKVGVDSSAITNSHDYLLTHLPAQVQNVDIGAYELRAKTFYSDQTTGNAPFTVLSTTVVTNLNADTVDGYSAASLIEFASGDLMLSTNTSPGSGWTDVSSSYENKFIRITSGTPLDTGGSDTHTHGVGSYAGPSHTHYVTFSESMASGNITTVYLIRGSNGQQRNTSASGTGAVTGTSASANNVPAYIELRMFQKD